MGGCFVLMRHAISRTVLLAVVLVVPLWSKAGGDNLRNDIPVLMPTFVSEALKVGGKISDSSWARAQKADNFQLIGGKGPATQQTEVRVCYDRSALHIRFECAEDAMDSIVVRYREDDSPVWQDDSVEVFICPYSVASQARCHQFVVNAAGAKAYLKPGGSPTAANWNATVIRLRDRWIANIIIPYETLKPLGRNEDCWRINFCRNEHPHGETSSWSPVERWFATYARFGKLVAPVAAFQFNTFRGSPKLLKSEAIAPVGIAPIEGPVKYLSVPSVIIPQPQEVCRRRGRDAFRIESDTRIVLQDDANEVDLQTAAELNARIVELGGKPLNIVRAYSLGYDPGRVRNVILIGEPSRHRLLRAFCSRDGVRMPRSLFGTTSHVVDVLPERIIVSGQTKTDTFYGVQTLKQLIGTSSDGSLNVPSIAVRDYPRFSFRSVHLLAASDALSYISTLIERVLAPLKVNHIVLQTDKVVWKSHPEVTDPSNYMTQDDVRKLIEIARKHHITVTPLVQSPGHLEWAFRNGANLDFAEDPNTPYCYCMSNPKSYEFIFDIIDEAIELFGNPEYFHAGRDEFDMRGTYPNDEKCKSIGKEQLYIQDTLRIYEHLRSKGCKMMMWGDILLKPGFREFVDELPKDILINDWHYDSRETYPSVEFFKSHGFQVVGCTWYNPRNIFSFSAHAARQSALGMMQTTWTGFEPAEQVLRKYPAQVYAYILSAAWAWNPTKPEVNNLPYRPEAVFAYMWRGQRPQETSKFAAVRIDRFCNISRSDSARGMGWLGLGYGNDLRMLPSGFVNIDGVPYYILRSERDVPSAIMLGAEGMMNAFPRRVDDIPVGSKLKALHFLHGCAYAVDKGAKVGDIIIRYEDGKTEQIPLIYEENTYAWDDQSLGMAYGFAWQGRAPDGRAVGVCDLAWVNKRPEVKIESIDFASASTQASPFLLAITAEL